MPWAVGGYGEPWFKVNEVAFTSLFPGKSGTSIWAYWLEEGSGTGGFLDAVTTGDGHVLDALMTVYAFTGVPDGSGTITNCFGLVGGKQDPSGGTASGDLIFTGLNTSSLALVGVLDGTAQQALSANSVSRRDSGVWDWTPMAAFRNKVDATSPMTIGANETVQWYAIAGVEVLGDAAPAPIINSVEYLLASQSTNGPQLTGLYWVWGANNLLETVKYYGSNLAFPVSAKGEMLASIYGPAVAPTPLPVLSQGNDFIEANASGMGITKTRQSDFVFHVVNPTTGDWASYNWLTRASSGSTPKPSQATITGANFNVGATVTAEVLQTAADQPGTSGVYVSLPILSLSSNSIVVDLAPLAEYLPPDAATDTGNKITVRVTNLDGSFGDSTGASSVIRDNTTVAPPPTATLTSPTPPAGAVTTVRRVSRFQSADPVVNRIQDGIIRSVNPAIEAISELPVCKDGTFIGRAWTDATLVNWWTWFGQPTAVPGYYLDPAGVVRLRGSIAGGVSGRVAFVLPVGLRPGAAISMAVPTNNGTTGIVVVTTDGQVIPSAAASDTTSPNSTPTDTVFALDGVTFRAEK